MGSSGFYSAEMIERDGPAAFPAGSFLYFNHMTESESWERSGSRDVKDIVGKLITDAEYVAEEEALYADALFYSKHADFVKDISDDIELSIEGQGRRNEDSGEITELVPNPHNAIALVPRGGRDGKITAFLESLSVPEMLIKESGRIVDIENTPEKESTPMTPEDIQAVAEALAKAIAPALDEIKESLKPAEPAETPAIAEVVEALINADIPEDLRTRVYESEKPLETIADIKAIRESVAKPAKEDDEAPLGRVRESATSSSFTSTAWSTR